MAIYVIELSRLISCEIARGAKEKIIEISAVNRRSPQRLFTSNRKCDAESRVAFAQTIGPMKSHLRFAPKSFLSSHAPVQFNLMEREFSAVIQRTGEQILHHCDRPDIEVQILGFLRHAVGATTAGIARAMGISTAAAEVHLRCLSDAHRIWGQPIHGGEMEWYLGLEGRHFLKERGSEGVSTPEWHRAAA
jgi:hypothetical protein